MAEEGTTEGFVPHTVETITPHFNGAELDSTRVEAFVGVANKHEFSPDAVKALAEFSGSSLTKATEYTPITGDQIKGFLGDDADAKVDEKFVSFAEEHKLSEDVVRGIVELDKTRMEKVAEANQQEWANQQTTWRGELEKDSLLTGGEGYDKNLASIHQVVADYGGEAKDGVNEFQQALNITGMGNHPAMARFLMKIAAALPSEGKPTTSGPGAPSDNSREVMASRWFPSMEKQG